MFLVQFFLELMHHSRLPDELSSLLVELPLELGILLIQNILLGLFLGHQ